MLWLLLLLFTLLAGAVGEGLTEVRLASVGRRNRHIISWIKHQKAMTNGNYTVIDVGGSMNGWSAPVVDFLVDKNPPSKKGRYTFFKVETINDSENWEEILQHVAKKWEI
jgi:hypothetical protein